LRVELIFKGLEFDHFFDKEVIQEQIFRQNLFEQTNLFIVQAVTFIEMRFNNVKKKYLPLLVDVPHLTLKRCDIDMKTIRKEIAKLERISLLDSYLTYP
jgi:hypothetical protein